MHTACSQCGAAGATSETVKCAHTLLKSFVNKKRMVATCHLLPTHTAAAVDAGTRPDGRLADPDHIAEAGKMMGGGEKIDIL